MTGSNVKLELRFHGRIIDALGIQMYQSPVAAIAELIANAWDADATEVNVKLPGDVGPSSLFVIGDDGDGMTLAECQDFYLSVGRNRRIEGHPASVSGRPVLGRKGIGKFAGFGIAAIIEVDTISKASGERTVFRLELEKLRGTEFVETDAKDVEVRMYEPPDEARKDSHGTTVRLLNLNISRRPSQKVFLKSMGRRFLLAQEGHDFSVKIDGDPLPDPETLFPAQFDFPEAYTPEEIPSGLTLDGKWGKESLADGNEIKWRVKFLAETISEDEFRGVSVYCGIKVAQTPFIFQLTGGLPGQHGLSYLTGTVKADYLDRQGTDIITTERQRINWENEAALPLLEWGQKRLRELLRIWAERRASEKEALLDARISQFANRLRRLTQPEQKTVKNALRKLAGIDSLSAEQFVELSSAVLTAWETGRLRDIITDISRAEELTESVLLTILVEARALNALNIAEVIKLKVEVLRELRRRIEQRDIENSIRDFIAQNPWLIASRWEFFKKEKRIDSVLEDAAKDSGLADDPEATKRIDLALSSGSQLLIVEFMRPGLALDRDHVSRFQLYVHTIREKLRSISALGLTDVTGLLVADKLDRKVGMVGLIDSLKSGGMEATTWDVLLSSAQSNYKDYLDILVDRSNNDQRVAEIRDTVSGPKMPDRPLVAAQVETDSTTGSLFTGQNLIPKAQ